MTDEIFVQNDYFEYDIQFSPDIEKCWICDGDPRTYIAWRHSFCENGIFVSYKILCANGHPLNVKNLNYFFEKSINGIIKQLHKNSVKDDLKDHVDWWNSVQILKKKGVICDD